MSSLLPFFKRKTEEDLEKKIQEKYKELDNIENNEQLTEEQKTQKTQEIQGKIDKYTNEIQEIQEKKEKKEVKKAEKETKKAEIETKRQEEIKKKTIILGGFFIYRVNTSNSKNVSESIDQEPQDDYSQKGEITGMVLIKQNGDRRFMTYVSIDPKTNKVDDFMEPFKDTMIINESDYDTKRVFEIDSLKILIEKLIVQPMEDEEAEVAEKADEKNDS